MTETIERFSLKNKVSNKPHKQPSQYLEVSKNEISVTQETIQKMLSVDESKKNSDTPKQEKQINNNNQQVLEKVHLFKSHFHLVEKPAENIPFTYEFFYLWFCC